MSGRLCPRSGFGVPQGIDREGAQAVSEGEGLLAGVEDVSGHQPRAQEITAMRQVLPAAEMPRLRSQMNDTLLEPVYDDPLNAWEDIPVLELTGPLDGRLDAVLAALGQSR